MGKLYAIVMLFVVYSCDKPPAAPDVDNRDTSVHGISLQEIQPSFKEGDIHELIRNSANLSDKERSKHVISILSTSDSARLHEVSGILLKAFDDPNSPYRNENLAIAVRGFQLRSPWFTTLEKQTISERQILSLRNRVGNTALDFAYCDPRGTRHNMHAIRSPFTLLYFYNPECHACKEMTEALTSSPTIFRKLEDGTLTILAVYPDADPTIWHNHLPSLPKTWLHGHDRNETIWRNKLYDLRAIPTLYLLDSSKTVLVKDGTLPDIEKTLTNTTTYAKENSTHPEARHIR